MPPTSRFRGGHRNPGPARFQSDTLSVAMYHACHARLGGATIAKHNCSIFRGWIKVLHASKRSPTAISTRVRAMIHRVARVCHDFDMFHMIGMFILRIPDTFDRHAELT
jgi:hypothetical protein